jgi:hypothetical protein
VGGGGIVGWEVEDSVRSMAVSLVFLTNCILIDALFFFRSLSISRMLSTSYNPNISPDSGVGTTTILFFICFLIAEFNLNQLFPLQGLWFNNELQLASLSCIFVFVFHRQTSSTNEVVQGRECGGIFVDTQV